SLKPEKFSFGIEMNYPLKNISCQFRNAALSYAILIGYLATLLCVTPGFAQSERPRTATGASQATNSTTEDWFKKLSAEEQSAIDRSGKGNDRVKTYVRLAEVRLQNARAALSRDELAASGEQLNFYIALIASAGEYTRAYVPQRDKAHKTLEQALRSHLRLLEGIRRDTSADYAEPVGKALAMANRLRVQSLNLLLGNGAFLSEQEKDAPKKDPEEKSEEN
ncbi:MAG TPA: hypothetical protein VEF04_14580, partial [Blastocatellia bacterium]|nr:hypothetical protein [Blastocatellia bacterium]